MLQCTSVGVVLEVFKKKNSQRGGAQQVTQLCYLVDTTSCTATTLNPSHPSHFFSRVPRVQSEDCATAEKRSSPQSHLYYC